MEYQTALAKYKQDLEEKKVDETKKPDGDMKEALAKDLVKLSFIAET